MEIMIGQNFFWNGIFPYLVVATDADYITYTRTSGGYEKKRVYRYVFEDAIKRGQIELF